MSPQDFCKRRDELRRRIAEIEEEIQSAYESAIHYPIPEKLRPMRPEDVVLGQVVWYPEFYDPEDEFPAWEIVEELRNPEDDWKAFISNGSRYGLNGAFVEA